MNNKMNKDTIPSDFTLGLALVDAMPVLFFGIACILLGIKFEAYLFIAGAAVSFVSGFIKVLWKIIVAVGRKNVWWMFIQMRIAMPVGFIIMIADVFLQRSKLSGSVLSAMFLGMPQLFFYGISVIGIILMILFSIILDSSDLKSNWIEQSVNGIAQLAFMIGVILS